MDTRAVSEKPEKVGITHDTAARLIGLAPGELTDLVRDGFVHRNDKNSYSVPVLVGEYCAYLRAEAVRPEAHPKQTETAAHLDLSDRSIREWEVRLEMQDTAYTLSEFRIAYIRALRDGAAGRYADGDLDLAKERSLLARAQREKIEMENAEKRNLLIPADEVEPIMTEAVVYARERLLEAVPRLAREMPDDVIGREEMLQAEFEAFLNRLADWANADEYIDEDGA